MRGTLPSPVANDEGASGVQRIPVRFGAELRRMKD